MVEGQKHFPGKKKKRANCLSDKAYTYLDNQIMRTSCSLSRPAPETLFSFRILIVQSTSALGMNITVLGTFAQAPKAYDILKLTQN